MSSQAIAILINFFVFLLVIVGTFVLVRKLKFYDNNSRVIFLLYIVYWISPLICRDYTTAMHLYMGNSINFIWIPVAAFGAIGILWRPLNDILTYKTKSRKLIIYLSIGIQVFTLLPFLLYPCFETNLVQSIGTGIGASGIGLFTLMFNESNNKNHSFLTISIFALPPIIAGFIVSALESFIACFTPSNPTAQKYVSVFWYIWLIALVFVIISFIMTFFVGERRETLYQDKQYKQPVKKASGHWKVILLCICGVCLALMRWATIGPFSGMELSYIASQSNINTSLWEGYLGLVYSFGCLLGSIGSAFAIIKCKKNIYQPIVVASAIAIWIIFIMTTGFINDVTLYLWLQIINGIAFGLVWNILMHLVLNKFYIKRDIVTPIGFFNMSLSIGIVLGSIFIGFTKAKYFRIDEATKWSEYVKLNQTCSYILLGITMFMFGCFLGYWFIKQNTKGRRKLKHRSIALMGEIQL